MKLTLSFLLFFLISTCLKSQGIYQLWGMASKGGTNGLGTIFSTDSRGRNIKNRFSFDISKPGGKPFNSELTEYNGQLFGVASYGGKNQIGVIFKWDPVSDEYVAMHHFSYDEGALPHGKLTLYDNKFYGMTTDGGLNGLGVLFEWDPTSNIYIKKQDLRYVTGCYPYGGLTVKDGNLYGMTTEGGTSAKGVIFEWNPKINLFTKICSLNSTNGQYPIGNLTLYQGRLFGMTFNGGETDRGVIFEYLPESNSCVKKQDLSQQKGSNPRGSLSVKGDKLYGMTWIGGKFEYGNGVIFEWDPVDNIYNKKVDLRYSSGGFPFSNLTLFGEKFFGTCSNGSDRSEVLFEWDPATNIYQVKQNIPSSFGESVSNALYKFKGKLYGLTANGSVNQAGCLFEFDPATNDLQKRFDFSETNGSIPLGGLTLQDNKLYGMTSSGGKEGLGVLFEWNLANNLYTRKQDFSPEKGSSPHGDLVFTKGKFYGTTYQGGTSNSGVIFEWDPLTNVYTKKQNLSTSKGYFPSGAMTLKDEKLYGMTTYGGLYGYGVIFEWNYVTNTYTKKQDLTPTNGGRPHGNLVLKNGTFYGMSSSGLFKWDSAGNIFSKMWAFGDVYGYPYGSLTLKDGVFYGMTTGRIFAWEPTLNAYSEKKIFDTYSEGIEPLGSLTLKNNKFYGLTSKGGSHTYGTVFEWDPVDNVYSKTDDFDTDKGMGPQYGGLTMVPAPVAKGNPGSCISFEPLVVSNLNNNEWLEIIDLNGDAVAEINANGNNLGKVETSLYVNDGPVRYDSQNRFYLNRNITITPENKILTSGKNVDIRIYITKGEFEALSAASGEASDDKINGISDLQVFKSQDNFCKINVDTKASQVISSVSSWNQDYVFSASVGTFSTFYIANKNYDELPVRLISIEAKVQEDAGLISWKTNSEINFSHFEIQRSEDGRGFNTIGRVESSVSGESGNYNFIDIQLTDVKTSIVYYRLKIVDLDGSYSFSTVVRLFRTANTNVILVHPNPVADILYVNTVLNQDSNWKIIDSRGVIQMSGTNHSKEFAVDTHLLGIGEYVLKIEGQVGLKFVKK